MVRVCLLAFLCLAVASGKTKVHKTTNDEDVITSVNESLADVEDEAELDDRALEESENLEASDNEKGEDDVQAIASESPSREMEELSHTVVADIDRLLSALEEESDMPSNVLSELSDNLREMRKDAQLMSTSSQERASLLKQALHKRYDALKMMFNNVKKDSEDNSEDYSDMTASSVEKILDDVQKVKASLEEEESNIPEDVLSSAKEDVEQIAIDAKKLKLASPNSAMQLKKAMRLRVQALKQILSDGEVANSKDVESPEKADDSRLANVESDVLNLEEYLSKLHMPASDKKVAQSNLKAIKRDAEQFSSAHGAERQRLQKALNLRMKALKMQFEENQPTEAPLLGERRLEHHAAKHSKNGELATRIVADVQRVKQEMKAKHLSSAARTKVNDNLAHMLRDAEEISAASESRKEKLVKSLQLRTSALKKQLQ